MVKRYLVTTADEDTWPDEGESILFLGEWCKRYSHKSKWEKFSTDIEPYHWNNRKKLHEDYLYLQELYETLLIDLSYKLNQIHSVEYSIRYWRILIGPWLNCFLHMLFDRWFMLKQVIEEGKVDRCNINERQFESLIPIDMDNFNEIYIKDDWNEGIYGQLIKLIWHDKLLINKTLSKQYNKGRSYQNTWKINIKRLISSAIYNLNKLSAKDDDFFFISSYLSLKNEFQLQFKLGQFPKKWYSKAYSTNKKPDNRRRQWRVETGVNNDIFSKIACQIIPKHIPIVYLEGYRELVKKSSELAWPKKPKAIFTSNAYSSDDLFKCWAAEKTDNGTALVIGQHGGNFGMTPFASHEEHQVKISDKWLSWGWKDPVINKIVPIGNFKASTYMARNKTNKTALMVTMTMPRYSYYLYAVPIAGQWIKYFECQKKFLKTLPNELSKKILLRIYHQDYGWDQLSRWNDNVPNIRIDYGSKKFDKMLSSSRIFIGTYNATTYLETLALNIPTIVFWDREYWELKDEVKPYFILLKEVKIFHDTPEQAAKHLASIWDDIDLWWMSEEVQKARKDFCNIFSYKNDNLIIDLESVFREYE